MKKYNVIGVHRDTGFIRGFTLEAPSPKAAIRAAKFSLRQDGEIAAAYKYLVTEV